MSLCGWCARLVPQGWAYCGQQCRTLQSRDSIAERAFTKREINRVVAVAARQLIECPLPDGATPRPLLAPDAEQRKACRNLGPCLNYAVVQQWNGYSCVGCKAFVSAYEKRTGWEGYSSTEAVINGR